VGAAAVDPAPRPRPRRRLSPLRRALFALVPLVVLLGGAELFFRIRERLREHQKEARGALLSPREADMYRGNVLVPGRRLVVAGRVQEINALGMRAPEVSRKRPGETRVLCIGGSTTFGLYTSSNERTWPARAGAKIAAAGHPDVTVWNAGCPAWDVRTSQTNLDLRLYEAVEPDIIVACHAYNDVVANLDPQYERASRAEEPRELRQWVQASAMLRFLFAYFRAPSDALAHKADHMSAAGLEAYERNLRRLIARSAARGARVVLCTEPSCYRATLAESEQAGVPGLEQWFHDLSPLEYPTLVATLARYNEKIREVARDTGCLLIDLERLMPHDVSLFETPVHHKDSGDEIVGHEVARALLESGLLGQGPRAP
jgi:hypothetical protein